MVQAINPKQVHWELFTWNYMAEALPVPPDAWSAVPFPAPMLQ